MKKPYLTLTYCFILVVIHSFFVMPSYGQTSVSDDSGYVGEASAVLDVNSTTKGMLIPRLSETQRLAITGLVEGLFVYDTDLKRFYYYNGSDWAAMNIVNAYDTDTTFVITKRVLLEGDAIVWDDLRVPVESTTKGGTKDPDFGQFLNNGSSQGVWIQWFDKTTEEELYFTVQIPHSYKVGSNIQPHVHWVTDDASDLNVVWGLEYSWANMNDTFSNTTIITGTGSNSGANYHHMTSLGIIDGTGKSYSSMLVCRIFRDASNTADTFPQDAGLLEIDFHFQVQSFGTEYNPVK